MFKLLIPDIYVTGMDNIPLAQLTERGIRGLIIDLDNTVTEWNSSEIKTSVAAWFKKLSDYNLQACLVSNNSQGRVEQVASQLGIPFIHKAGKPRRKAFRKALKVMNISSGEAAVIGDQVFTDVLGGNRAGLFTVLVVPLAPREFIGTRLMRKLERLVLTYIIKTKPER